MILESDHELAADLAGRAGRLLLRLRRQLRDQGAPAAVLKSEGDCQSQKLLGQELTHARPDDAVLSEEEEDDGSRHRAERVWILDPLDGTREFSEPPRVDWAVHVALTVNGRPEVGAVALPAQGMVLSTRRPPELPAAPDGPPRLAVSRTRPPPETRVVADRLGAQLIAIGSAGAKAMAVVRGKVHAYVHSGGMYEWDSCAPVAVAAAAGCIVSRIDGSKLRYNQLDLWQPDLVISRPEFYTALMTALSKAS